MAAVIQGARFGMVLTGGGARAAYQVGVLRSLARLMPGPGGPLPFPVLTGTSAGAINAAALAAHAVDFPAAVERLSRVWSGFHAAQVYRTDAMGVMRTGARWLTMMSIGWALTRWWRMRPRSLLDNSPLADLLAEMIPVERIGAMLEGGQLEALAVCASSYTSGEHITFYQSRRHVPCWSRSQRRALEVPVGIDHLLASAAIPFVFPPRSLPLEGVAQWFGDGSMRQVAPISPAIQLGADRILVVGAGRLQEPGSAQPQVPGGATPPSFAQVAGHALSSIFLDALAVDIERLQRINRTLNLLPPEVRSQTSLRPIEVLVIAPSQRIDDIAARHADALPLFVRSLLRGIGIQPGQVPRGGSALLSYLLFESVFTQELIALGERDAWARREEVCAFMGWPAPGQGGAAEEGGGAARAAAPLSDVAAGRPAAALP